MTEITPQIRELAAAHGVSEAIAEICYVAGDSALSARRIAAIKAEVQRMADARQREAQQQREDCLKEAKELLAKGNVTAAIAAKRRAFATR